MTALKVVAVSLSAYALFLPVAMWVSRGYLPTSQPAGRVIEKVGRMDLDLPDHYYARLYVFRPTSFPDTSKIAVYEDLTPLSDTSFAPHDGSYIVRFKASDGSDPRANGRNYWVVLP
jgi:hypothetical protein